METQTETTRQERTRELGRIRARRFYQLNRGWILLFKRVWYKKNAEGLKMQRVLGVRKKDD